MNKNKQTSLKVFFLPFLLFCFFLQLAVFLLKPVTSYFSETALAPPSSLLQGLSLLAMILLVFLSNRFSVEKILKGVLYLSLFLFSFLGFILIPLEKFCSFYLALHNPLSFCHFGFFLLQEIAGSGIFLLLTWGYLNEKMTVEEGKKNYIWLAACLQLILFLFSSSFLKFSINSSFVSSLFLFIAIISFFIAYRLFFHLSKKEIHPEKNQEINENSWKKTFFLSFIFSSFFIGSSLFTTLLKSEARYSFVSSLQYTTWIGSYSFYLGLLSFFFSCLFLGTFFVLVRKDFFPSLFLVPLILALFLGITSYFVWIFSLTPSLILNACTQGILQSAKWTVFPLLQIAYLFFPLKMRFITKLLTEVIFFKLFLLLPKMALQSALFFSGLVVSVSFLTFCFFVATLLIAILLISLEYNLLSFGKKIWQNG